MGFSILCVDADRNLCQVMAKALEAVGHTVETEHDGERALALIAEEAPDLVLLDLFLPGRDGFSVLEAVRKLPGPAQATPVLLLSGCSVTPEYQQRAARLAAAALLTKPVPLAELTACVSRELGTSKSLESVAQRGAFAAVRSEFSGELERFSFAALLHHLHGSRATGVLHLQAGRKRKWVQLRDGYPVGVRSNLLGETLGNLLERRGRVSAAVVRESRERLGDGQLQGEMLVAMEVLSEEELSAVLREQADAKLHEIFEWSSGRFRFEFGGQLHRASGMVRRSPANIILGGVRSRMSLERIDSWLEAQRHLLLARAEEPFYRFQEVELEPEYRCLVEGLGSGRALEEFLSADEGTRRTLFGLLRAGLLDVHAAGSPRPEPTPASAEATTGLEREVQRADLAAMVERFANESAFEILDVPEDVGAKELQAAYERMSARTHPDRVSSHGAAVRRLAAETFAHVERAYERLRDPELRQRYISEHRSLQRVDREQAAGRRAHLAEQHFQQGKGAVEQRQHQNALAHFGKALELFPEEGEYHAYYAWALHLCHPDDVTMTEEAIEHCKRGMKLASDREKPYLFMGRLCKVTGRAGVAERMFTRAVQIQPDCVEALRELRLINMRREKEKGLIRRLLRR
ncbi:MAG: response regulator [Deltaproteobacteria bacterium]|nr:response regulator [Deltaproteobacteria bacterium]